MFEERPMKYDKFFCGGTQERDCQISAERDFLGQAQVIYLHRSASELTLERTSIDSESPAIQFQRCGQAIARSDLFMTEAIM